MLLVFNQHYIVFAYIILTKTWKILYSWYHNMCMIVVTYCIAARFN